MTVAFAAGELERKPRAVAVGTFDGVHVGHRRVIDAAAAAGLTTTVVTFDPHPRSVLGSDVPLLTTLERRLELLAAAGVDDVLVVPFDLALARVEPEDFAREYLASIGAEVVIGGESFRFGRGRRGALEDMRRLGFDTRPVPLVEAVSSTRIRQLLLSGAVEAAASALGRPYELDGRVVAGDARGGTLGFPTANLELEPQLLVPGHGIYAGSARGCRAAVSIGVNPHYGGREQRIEAFLLDFDGDLYGRRLLVELWRRLRDEQAFASEEELVAQIARDVEETRRAQRPA